MLRKHVFLACFAMLAVATVVLSNVYRAKADAPPSAALSAGPIDALMAPIAPCADQWLGKVLVTTPNYATRNAKGRKTGCGL